MEKLLLGHESGQPPQLRDEKARAIAGDALDRIVQIQTECIESFRRRQPGNPGDSACVRGYDSLQPAERWLGSINTVDGGAFKTYDRQQVLVEGEDHLVIDLSGCNSPGAVLKIPWRELLREERMAVNPRKYIASINRKYKQTYGPDGQPKNPDVSGGLDMGPYEALTTYALVAETDPVRAPVTRRGIDNLFGQPAAASGASSAVGRLLNNLDHYETKLEGFRSLKPAGPLPWADQSEPRRLPLDLPAAYLKPTPLQRLGDRLCYYRQTIAEQLQGLESPQTQQHLAGRPSSLGLEAVFANHLNQAKEYQRLSVILEAVSLILWNERHFHEFRESAAALRRMAALKLLVRSTIEAETDKHTVLGNDSTAGSAGLFGDRYRAAKAEQFANLVEEVEAKVCRESSWFDGRRLSQNYSDHQRRLADDTDDYGRPVEIAALRRVFGDALRGVSSVLADKIAQLEEAGASPDEIYYYKNILEFYQYPVWLEDQGQQHQYHNPALPAGIIDPASRRLAEINNVELINGYQQRPDLKAWAEGERDPEVILGLL